jgi:N6-adenosine-specific RNA methylase IME4
VINAPRREHSRKPDEAYEMVEAMYPELPKIELFARQARPGWRAWGNEVASPDDGIPNFLRRTSSAAI